jgi:hypothetical protein
MKRNLFALVFILIGWAVMAQSAVKKELYKSARDNFSNEAYVDALRDFSGFQAANDAYLELHPNLKKAIGSAITICENKIEESRRADERRNSGVMEIEANAIYTMPGPIYLLPTDSILPHAIAMEWNNALFPLQDHPFASLQVLCLSNADSLGLQDYVRSRIELFKSATIGKDFASDRITWEVDSLPADPGYISSCMRYYMPPKGSICLSIRLNLEAEMFELEPE